MLSQTQQRAETCLELPWPVTFARKWHRPRCSALYSVCLFILYLMRVKRGVSPIGPHGSSSLLSSTYWPIGGTPLLTLSTSLPILARIGRWYVQIIQHAIASNKGEAPWLHKTVGLTFIESLTVLCNQGATPLLLAYNCSTVFTS